MKRSRRVPILEGLEDRRVLSHVIPQLHHALLPHHAAAHKAAVHIPRTVTSFGANHGHVVHQSRPRAAAARLALPAGNFGGGNVDLTIPFIVGTDVGAAQNALNFTSNTYQNVLFGTGGWDGIQQIVQRFGDTNDANQLGTDITALAVRMPYGVQKLLPIWTADLELHQSGSLSVPQSGIDWGTTPTGQAVGDLLFRDLQAYLGAGLGVSFNVLKSVIDWDNSDALLTYNGTVGSNNLT
jgi:hypothetical protein